jgi:uncharacterized alpha-E superfamily protein
MLSRVADSVFWMSRYLERAESAARFIDVNLNLTLDLGSGIDQQWAPLVYTTGDQEAFLEEFGEFNRENVWRFLTFDAKNPNSIVSCLRSARENARTVREVIPSLLWEEINKFYLFVRAAATDHTLDDAQAFLDEVKLRSLLTIGIQDATMSHGEPFHFGRMGRLLERADKTSRILDVKYFILLPSVAEVGTPLDVIQWSALLKSASALEMYRKAKGRISPEQVVDFLVLDREFPRSIHSCLINTELSLHAVTGTALNTFRNPAEQKIGQLRSQLDFVHLREIMRAGLHEFIDRIQTELNEAGAAIHETFFAARAIPGAEGAPSQTQTQ